MRVDQLTIGPDLVCEVRIRFGIQYFRPFYRRGITPSAWGGIITALASAVRQFTARPVEPSATIGGLLRLLLPLVCDEASCLGATSTSRQRNQKRGLRMLLLRQEEHYLLFYSPRYGVRDVSVTESVTES